MKRIIIYWLRILHLEKYVLWRLRYRLPLYLKRKRLIQKIRKKKYANVVFFAVNLPMWRYQKLYERLRQDERFHITVVIAAFNTITAEETIKQQETVKKYFDSVGVFYKMVDELPDPDYIKSLDPDILFYVQPYKGIFRCNVDATSFKDKLLCYYPYSFQNINYAFGYNSWLHIFGWRLYYPTVFHKRNAKKICNISDCNVRVVGEPHADDFKDHEKKQVWHNTDNRKRIIWAPHFQIIQNDTFNRASFLWSYKIIIEIAQRYQDKIQIAFKPHPRLFSELGKHPDWGVKRARDFYEIFESMPNTQVEIGNYIDLFKESDALIHDCGSFTAEYMFVKKPCMFLTKDPESVKYELCEFGKKCFDLHNVGTCEEDIYSFIDNIVLACNDPKRLEREEFYNEYLLPPNGKTTAENTYDDLVHNLFGDKIK